MRVVFIYILVSIYNVFNVNMEYGFKKIHDTDVCDNINVASTTIVTASQTTKTQQRNKNRE